MSIDQNWLEYQKSHAEAGVVAMGNLLDEGGKEDVLYVLKEIISLIEEIPVSDDKSGAINELLGDACENLEIAHSMMGGGE